MSSPLRRMAERMSRGVVLRRSWPSGMGGGHVYVTPDAMLKAWTRPPVSIDPELMQVAKILIRPGDRVWDIGSNMGLFSVAATHLAGSSGEVFSFEPDTFLVSLLRRTARRRKGRGAPMRVIPVAVSNEVGLAQFLIAEAGRAANSLREDKWGVRERQDVLTVTMDWLAERLGAPKVVKIDVESAEVFVMQGARRVLAENRPRMYVEVVDSCRDEVTAILGSAGYKFYSVQNASLRQESHAVWNTVAIHETDTI